VEPTAPELAALRPEPAAPGGPLPTRQPRGRSAGVSVVVGGLLQDLEDRVRRDLAPIEERVRPGQEVRGLAAAAGEEAPDLLVVVLPAGPADADLA
jgi:hypothetical protein